MYDDSNYNIQRRNLMILNVVMFFLAVTNKTIVDFKILNIDFSITQKIMFINSFNDILFIAWIYFFARFFSSVLYSDQKIKFEVRLLPGPKVYTSKIYMRIFNRSIAAVRRTILNVYAFCFNKNFYELFIPIIFFNYVFRL